MQAVGQFPDGGVEHAAVIAQDGWMQAPRATVMGFYFYPRGGSAQVVGSLCRALAGDRWDPTLFTGSLGTPGEITNAGRFFEGIRCEVLDYSSAVDAWTRGEDPMSAAVPLHASYEDKPDVPDRILVDLDDAAFHRQVASWTRLFAASTQPPPVVAHLHHLTPMHEAVRAVWPNTALVTHLHGTELKMLDALRSGVLDEGRARYGPAWAERMRRWAGESDCVVAISEQDRNLALDLLDVDASRVTTIANGVDTEVFCPQDVAPDERRARWRRWLVDDPRGWRPGGPEGSLRYQDEDLAAFTEDAGRAVPVVAFAGRFLAFKRLRLLIEAHHLMRSTTGQKSVLVIIGGFPGEWEGEHPYDTVARLGAEGVFFAGWRGHDVLAQMLACSDVFAAPSVDEPFGLVFLEAMAAGLPPIATSTGGPATFINLDPARPTGWLVPPDDVPATAGALTEAVSNPLARTERGQRAARFVADHYSWPVSAAAMADLYRRVADERAVAPVPGTPDRALLADER